MLEWESGRIEKATRRKGPGRETGPAAEAEAWVVGMGNRSLRLRCPLAPMMETKSTPRVDKNISAFGEKTHGGPR